MTESLKQNAKSWGAGAEPGRRPGRAGKKPREHPLGFLPADSGFARIPRPRPGFWRFALSFRA